MIFTRDFVTRENYWQITSLVTQKSLFTVTHALFFISPKFVHRDANITKVCSQGCKYHQSLFTGMQISPKFVHRDADFT